MSLFERPTPMTSSDIFKSSLASIHPASRWSKSDQAIRQWARAPNTKNWPPSAAGWLSNQTSEPIKRRRVSSQLLGYRLRRSVRDNILETIFSMNFARISTFQARRSVSSRKRPVFPWQDLVLCIARRSSLPLVCNGTDYYAPSCRLSPKQSCENEPQEG